MVWDASTGAVRPSFWRATRRLAARFDSAAMAQAQQTAPATLLIPKPASAVGSVSGPQRPPKILLTQSTLAQMLGVRRTTVTLIAGRLETAGVIDGRRPDTCT